MKDFEKIDKLLWQGLSSKKEPDDGLNQQIINNIRGRNNMKYGKKKRMSVAAMFAIVMVITSISAFAAWQLLTPKQVAENLGDKGLAIAFEGEDALSINETQVSGDYEVTLLGIVSGKKISEFRSSIEDIYPGRTYAVVAIANTDGRPMPSTQDDAYGEVPFFVSPLIKGKNPREFNIITMNGGYSEMVEDGIMYRIIECDDIEIFADRGLYLGVSSGTFYDMNAYNFDLETGEIIPNADYEGINILFDLPLDPSKGNYEKAEEYLQTLIDEQIADKESIDEEAIDMETLLAGATLILESVQEITPDEDDMISYVFNNQEIKTPLGSLFEEGQIGFSDTSFINDDNNIFVFSRDIDGIITGMVYKEK